MSATLRPALPSDADELVRVINLAYRVEDFFIDGDRTDREDVLDRMARPGCEFLVVADDAPGRLVAAVFVEERGPRTYFGLLSVDPSQQRRGLARRLIEAVEAGARGRGAEAVDIDVVDLRAELPAFYTSLGYVQTGTAPFKNAEKLTRPAGMLVFSKSLLPGT